MAWTSSAQRRGSFAFSLAAVSVDFAPILRRLKNFKDATAPRGAYVAAATATTLVGLALPYFTPAALSTFMLLAGAFIAALAMRPPYVIAKPCKGATAAPAASRPSSATREIYRQETRFLDLVARPEAAAVVDRAVWARLTAHMSHELRTPLNAVLGFSELMSNEVFGPMGSSCYSSYARDIHASGRMLLKSAEDALAITALLTAAPSADASPASVLSTSVNHALSFHAPAIAAQRISLALNVSKDEIVAADCQTVRQLLVNVVAEMLEHAAAGATIEIRSSATPCQTQLTISLSHEKSPRDAGNRFNMQLARTLADLSGARLSEMRNSAGATVTTIGFATVGQQDFFAAA